MGGERHNITVTKPSQEVQFPGSTLQNVQHAFAAANRKRGGVKRKRASTTNTKLQEPSAAPRTRKKKRKVNKQNLHGKSAGSEKSNKKGQKKKLKSFSHQYNQHPQSEGNTFSAQDDSPQLQRNQSSKGNVANTSGKKTGKKKKKIENKPPCKRIVCIAEAALCRCIDQRQSLGHESIYADDLSDFPKDMINTLPEIPYKNTKNPVVVVSSAASSNRAAAEIRAELSLSIRQGSIQQDDVAQFLGFDTETRPKFHKGGDENPPALIQLATQTTAYLFRLTFDGMNQNADSVMTESLLSLLRDQSIIKVGIGIHKDVEDLKRAYGAYCCGDSTSYLDLGPMVTFRWPKIKRAGLRNLTATVLRRKLSKAQQMKNWELKRLTPAMEAYAAADAWVSLDLLAAIVG